MKRIAAFLSAGALLGLGVLAFEPAVHDSGVAMGSQWQYVVSTEDNPCVGCCYTGYCCSVPQPCSSAQ